MRTIDVGNEFYHRLANRDEHQGDGKNTAVEFRTRFLSDLDESCEWNSDDTFIILDFSNVSKLGPSFANEAFAYFTKYAKPERILKRIQFCNISKVKLLTVKKELETGHRRRG